MSVMVIDAAAVVDLVCDLPAAGPFRQALVDASALAAPAHLDAEVISALGRLERAGRLRPGDERVRALARFPARRWPLRPLLEAAWTLRDRVAVKDALYVALAMSLEATLVTTDARLRKAARALVAVADP